MNQAVKIFLSCCIGLILLIWLCFFFNLWSSIPIIQDFSFYEDYQVYLIFSWTIRIFYFIILAYLIRVVWSYGAISKSRKNKWTWILLLFGPFAALYFIWRKDEEFQSYDQ